MTLYYCRNSIGVLCCLPTIIHLQAHFYGTSLNPSQSTLDQYDQLALISRDIFLGEKER